MNDVALAKVMPFPPKWKDRRVPAQWHSCCNTLCAVHVGQITPQRTEIHMKKLLIGLAAVFALSTVTPAFAGESDEAKKEAKKPAKKAGKKGGKKPEEKKAD